eukprot:COSAG05_NODE_4218_length_1616_cov_4.067238_1_plen_180_part_10
MVDVLLVQEVADTCAGSLLLFLLRLCAVLLYFWDGNGKFLHAPGLLSAHRRLRDVYHVNDGRNCGAGLVATFASDADYKVYASHDVHMRFIANEIQPIAAGRNALQFRLSGSIDAHTRAADEPPCILHAVLLTLNPETTDEQKTAILEGLAALPSTIPEIRSYSVGTQAAEVDDGRNVTL